MTANCIRCGAPTDAAVCRPEARSLADALVVAAGHAEDAETVIARQARYGAGSRGGRSEPLPVDLTASTRLRAVEGAIGTWARHVVEERGMELPVRRPKFGPLCEDAGCGHGSCERIRRRRAPSGLAAAAGWLATQVDWLRKRPEAGEAFDELEAACEQLRRLVDRPADRELVGVCDCGKVLYAARGRVQITCPQPTCKLPWHVERSREILRKHLRDKLVTAAEAARLAAYLDGDRTQDNIRKLIAGWVRHSLIVARGEIRDPDADDLEPTPTYRFGDISDRLARTPRRKREGVAA